MSSSLASPAGGRIFGKGSELKLIISTALLVGVTIFYLFLVGSFFAVMIYPLEHRVTNNHPFEFSVITSEIDKIVLGLSTLLWVALFIQNAKKLLLVLFGYGWAVAYSLFELLIGHATDQPLMAAMALASGPLIATLLGQESLRHFRKVKTSNQPMLFDWRLYSRYLTLVFFVLALTSLMYTTLIPSNDSGAGADSVRNYAHEIFLLTSASSPVFILILTSSFGPNILVRELLFSKRYPNNVASSLPSLAAEKSLPLSLKSISLTVAIVVSIVIVVVPHLPSVNPDGMLIGVDTEYYSNWQQELLRSESASEVFKKVFVEHASGDRPLFLLIQYSVIKLSGIAISQDGAPDPRQLSAFIEYFAIVLSALIVIVTYFLTREITGSDIAAIVSAFFAAVSFQVIITIYAGFYANLLALSFGYLSFLFMFKLLARKEFRAAFLVAFVACFIALYLTHVYTWTIFSIVLSVMLGIFFTRMKKHFAQIIHVNMASVTDTPRVIVAICIVLISVLAADISRSQLTGIPSGIDRHIALAEESSGASQYFTRWESIQNTVFVFGGGAFANVIVLGLGVYWILRANTQLIGNLFLMLFLAAGIIPLFLGDWIIQSRVLFNIPFHIIAGMAFWMLVNKPDHRTLLLAFTLYLWMVAEVIFVVANFPVA